MTCIVSRSSSTPRNQMDLQSSKRSFAATRSSYSRSYLEDNIISEDDLLIEDNSLKEYLLQEDDFIIQDDLPFTKDLSLDDNDVLSRKNLS